MIESKSRRNAFFVIRLKVDFLQIYEFWKKKATQLEIIGCFGIY
jgi:hypothetical protein